MRARFMLGKGLRPNGFSLIELMIVVAIIGILVAVAVPAYQGNVAVSSGSSAMRNLTGLVVVGQVCIQTGGGCDDLNSRISVLPELTETVNGGQIAKGQEARLVIDNGVCAIAAIISSSGVVAYSGEASQGVLFVSDDQCQRGAGLL